jgi:hypothetical protein
VKHFSEAQWVDFVRNLTLPKAKMAMQQHIDSGCSKCSDTLRTWQGVLSIAAGESVLAPPADAVHVVKSQFAAIRTTASSGVRLVFDSLLQPLTAGTRGSIAARQFLYETDEYYIDLRLEPRADDRAFLVGQVLNRFGADRAVQSVPIRLQDGKLPLAHTSTNEFGEFQLEFEAHTSLCVCIQRDEANEIILPLYGVHAPNPHGQDVD